jgi:hypothetical protein
MEQNDFLQALPETVTISGIWQTYKVRVGGITLDARKSRKVRDHSSEFSWGFAGSGPAQFALALLLLYVDADTAHKYHQQLKFGWIGPLPQGDFSGTYNLRAIMMEILEKRAKPSS